MSLSALRWDGEVGCFRRWLREEGEGQKWEGKAVVLGCD